MSIAISFAGMTIEGVWEWGEDVGSRVQAENFPRRHGSIVQRLAFLKERIVTLSGEVSKTDGVTLTTYLDTLSQTLSDKGRDRLYLHDDGRYLNAIKQGFSRRFIGSRAGARVAQFSVQFLADDPFWYSSTTESVLTSTVITSPTIIPVTNSGGSKTSPLIEVKALADPMTDVKISNGTTGLFVRYSGTINAGATLSIDCADFKAVVNGGNALNQITGTIEMFLEPGLNNIIYEGPLSGFGVDVNIVWIPRWN